LTSKKTYRVNSCLGLFVFLLAMLLPSLAFASKSADVTDLSFRSYPDHTRVVITLSDRAEFTKNRLSDPDRLYFDIRNCRIGGGVKTVLPVADGILKSIRTARFSDSTVRVVLDLEKGTDLKMVNLDDPARIVVDISRSGAAPVVMQPPSALKKRIVIDPGHGGHDTGAIGPDGLYEKDVVLDIALKVKKALSADPNYEVILTRDSDVFIPLAERTLIANRRNADLFVSIHANASPNREARGVETYFLNWTNDEETMKVAARENQITMKQMRQMKKDTNVLDVMLGDLARDNKRDESMALANYIQKKLVNGIDRDNPRVVNLGVKWALFYVLFGARMPSVLAEVSFISNPREERLLSKEGYREDIARSIAAGILKYMESTPGGQTVARNR
jgi:N-acetylmuramoyl-L-alanine amidase